MLRRLAFNALLGYCERHKDYAQCVDVMKLMETTGFKKNLLIYNHILANMYAVDRPSIDLEVHLLNSMRCTEMRDWIQGVLREMEREGIAPNHHSYSWLLGALRKEGNVKAMEIFWDKMTTAGSQQIPLRLCEMALCVQA